MFAMHDTCIHFVGIGGIGMSGIAEVLLTLGYAVSGTDLKESDTTRRLTSLGAHVLYGHRAEHLGKCDVVVISSAVSAANPEVVAARERGVPVIPRAEMLAELMRLKYGIAVAGSHGKTTTTSLVATILRHAGLDPTAVIGGKLPSLGSNARLGKGEILVAEADESDGSFMKLAPAIAVVTNIDAEHLDHYGTLDQLKRTFVDFINKVPFYGLGVLCIDHPNVQSLLPFVDKRFVTYGLAPLATVRAVDLEHDALESSFTVVVRGKELGRLTLPMPGKHNVLNALAAVAVADFLGVDFGKVREALGSFQGVGRRFSVKGEHEGVMVIDDYGHHPAEVRATLDGARAGYRDRRIVAAFQPHRYTRTRDLLSEFARAFNEADLVFVCDVYAAGEELIVGATSDRLVEEMRASGHPRVRHVPRRADLAAALAAEVSPGDIVITLGAGDITHTGEELLQRLRGAS